MLVIDAICRIFVLENDFRWQCVGGEREWLWQIKVGLFWTCELNRILESYLQG